ncbi:MAG: hypothetical protein GY822_30505 [Deltaproteobacteria bacterium]|nr:hypothetical protein [Deltaproteobacteria bacterium]
MRSSKYANFLVALCSLFFFSPTTNAQTSSSIVVRQMFDDVKKQELFPEDLEILSVEQHETGTQVFVKGSSGLRFTRWRRSRPAKT